MPILPRAASQLLQQALTAVRIVVVTGPRQAGKSTFVEHHTSLENVPIFTLDDPTILRRVRDDPVAFARSEPRMGIDEVQREPQLILAIKTVVDRQRPSVRGQFVLTGSANLLMMKQVGDSLAGRAYYLRLWPMTRREQLGLGTSGAWHHFFDTKVEHWLDVLRAEQTPAEPWQPYATRGGFPEVAMSLDGTTSHALAQTPANASADTRAFWFDGYIQTYLERDLRDLSAVADLSDFQRVMRAAALRIGNLLNQSELGRDVALPTMTVHRYLNLLETSYQIIKLEPYAVNRTTRLIKTPKLYWNDPGLALHLGYAGTSTTPSGAHFENLVLCDLLAWRDAQRAHTEVSYWRTASGYEVDFIIEHKHHLLGIEVKSGRQPTLRDVRGLTAMLEEYGDKVRGGVVLHGGDETYWMSDRIVAVPWWRVM